MSRRGAFSLGLLLILLTGCLETTSAGRREELRSTMAAIAQPGPNITPIVITVIQTVEITTTPRPAPTRAPTLTPGPTLTPTPALSATPLPGYVGPESPVSAGMEAAVRASLLNLGPGLELARLSRTSAGLPIFWIQDRSSPGTLLCGSPLYFQGLGSLLVLTSTNFYADLARAGAPIRPPGCLVLDLNRGALQVQRILRLLQAYANQSAMRWMFMIPEEEQAQADSYLAQFQNKPFPAELNLALVVLGQADAPRTSINLTMNYTAAGAKNRFRDSADEPFSLAGSPVLHRPVSYAQVADLGGGRGLLGFFDPALRYVAGAAPAVSLLKTNPLSTQEILAGRLGLEFWRDFLFEAGRVAGLGRSAPGILDTYDPPSAFLTPLQQASGFPARAGYTAAPEWGRFTGYLAGQEPQLFSSDADKIILRTREFLRDSYLNFVFIEE